MTKIKTLKNRKTGEQYAPRTHVKAVFDDNGNTLDSLLGVQDEKLSELGSEVRDSIYKINGAIGRDESEIVLTSSDLTDGVYNGKSFSYSPNYKSWVIPIYKDVEYKIKSDSYITSSRVCSQYPKIGEEIDMPLKEWIFTASEGEKYLIIAVNLGIYNNEEYVITHSDYGLHGKIDGIKESVENLSSDLEILSTHVEEVDVKTQQHNNELAEIKSKKADKYISKSIAGLYFSGTEHDEMLKSAINWLWLEILDDSLELPICYLTSLKNASGDYQTQFQFTLGNEADSTYLFAWYTNDGPIDEYKEYEIDSLGDYKGMYKLHIGIDWSKITTDVNLRPMAVLYLSEMNNAFTETKTVEEMVVSNARSIEGLQGEGESEIYTITPINEQNKMIYSPDSAQVGDYLDVNNVLNSDGWAYVVVPCKKGDSFIVKGEGTSNARLYWICDDNKVVIDCPSGAVDYTYAPLTLDINQENACFIVCNFRNYDPMMGHGLYKREIFTKRKLTSQANWKGKKIVCFGDSFTEMKGVDLWGYVDWLHSITSAEIVNLGIGGSCISQRGEPTLTPTTEFEAYAALDIAALVKADFEQDFIYQDAAINEMYFDDTHKIAVINSLKAMDWDNVDAVTIFAGTNDFKGESKLGESGDTDIRTVCGAINEIIRMLCTKHPNVKIYWFTPTVRYFGEGIEGRTDEYWGDNWINNLGATIVDYVDRIKGEVRKNKIPVCDMYNELGWNQYNFAHYFTKEGDIVIDNTHPRRGYRNIASKFVSFIESNRTF